MTPSQLVFQLHRLADDLEYVGQQKLVRPVDGLVMTLDVVRQLRELAAKVEQEGVGGDSGERPA